MLHSSGASSPPRPSGNCGDNARSPASPSSSIKLCDNPDSSRLSPPAESWWSSDTNVSDDLSNMLGYNNSNPEWSLWQDSDEVCAMPDLGCSIYAQAVENFLAVASVAWAND